MRILTRRFPTIGIQGQGESSGHGKWLKTIREVGAFARLYEATAGGGAGVLDFEEFR